MKNQHREEEQTDVFLNIQAFNVILDKLESIEETLAKMKAPPKSDIDGYVDMEYLCRTFNLSKDSVRRYRKAGIIPSYKLRGKVYFKLDEVTNAIKERVHGSKRSQ